MRWHEWVFPFILDLSGNNLESWHDAAWSTMSSVHCFNARYDMKVTPPTPQRTSLLRMTMVLTFFKVFSDDFQLGLNKHHGALWISFWLLHLRGQGMSLAVLLQPYFWIAAHEQRFDNKRNSCFSKACGQFCIFLFIFRDFFTGQNKV